MCQQYVAKLENFFVCFVGEWLSGSGAIIQLFREPRVEVVTIVLEIYLAKHTATNNGGGVAINKIYMYADVSVSCLLP